MGICKRTALVLGAAPHAERGHGQRFRQGRLLATNLAVIEGMRVPERGPSTAPASAPNTLTASPSAKEPLLPQVTRNRHGGALHPLLVSIKKTVVKFSTRASSTVPSKSTSIPR